MEEELAERQMRMPVQKVVQGLVAQNQIVLKVQLDLRIDLQVLQELNRTGPVMLKLACFRRLRM